MDDLLKALEVLFEMDGPCSQDEDGLFYYDRFNESDAAEAEASYYLIKPDGSCNWKNINELEKHGYKVYAGDKDSFGWLIGCIQKNGTNRVLTYG